MLSFKRIDPRITVISQSAKQVETAPICVGREREHSGILYYLSYIITVSAVARLIPKPPALVESRKQNLEEFFALNLSIRICLSAPGTFPSIRSYCHFCKHLQVSASNFQKIKMSMRPGFKIIKNKSLYLIVTVVFKQVEHMLKL